MSIKRRDVKDLIKKAKGYLKEDDPSFSLLVSYIKDAEDMLLDIKGNLTSAQKEIYDRLDVAVGP